MNTYKMLFKYHPKEIAVPYREICRDKDEFYKKLNLYIGIYKSPIFASLYNYSIKIENGCFCYEDIGKIHYCYCYIDKIWYDFDKINSIEIVKKFNDYLKKYDYKRLIIFSGRGFHIYIFTKNYEKIKLQKDTLFTAHLEILKDAQINYDLDTIKSDVDPKVIGDISRVARVFGTWHSEANLWCIPINENELEKGLEYIKNIAKVQRVDIKNYIIGTKYIDILNYEKVTSKPNIYYQNNFIKVSEIVKNKINTDKILKKTKRLCIPNMLMQDYCDYDDRFDVIIGFRDDGLLEFEVDLILKKYLNKKHPTRKYNVYKHSVHQEKQISSVFQKEHIGFSCKRVQERGRCVGSICPYFEKNDIN